MSYRHPPEDDPENSRPPEAGSPVAGLRMANQPTYPPDHQPGMRVPKGGSSCANCEYLGKDEKSCVNDYFIQWHGSGKLPAPADEFCSDWYAPAKPKERKDYFFGGR